MSFQKKIFRVEMLKLDVEFKLSDILNIGWILVLNVMRFVQKVRESSPVWKFTVSRQVSFSQKTPEKGEITVTTAQGRCHRKSLLISQVRLSAIYVDARYRIILKDGLDFSEKELVIVIRLWACEEHICR